MPISVPSNVSDRETDKTTVEVCTGDIQSATAEIRRGKTEEGERNIEITRMCANAQPYGRPAKHRWRPLFNAAKFG